MFRTILCASAAALCLVNGANAAPKHRSHHVPTPTVESDKNGIHVTNQSGGIVACRVDSVVQQDGKNVAVQIGKCGKADDGTVRITSTNQSGGIVAYDIGTVTINSGPSPDPHDN